MQKSQKQLTAVKNVAKAIAMLFIAVFLISTLNAIGVTAKAENLDPVAVYEQSNVTDDLKGATENGQESDYSAYKFSDKRKVEIISFVEFCYSANPDKQGDYGLYVYVYNPRGQDWTDKEKLNKIQLRCGGKANVEFNKYNLKYLNCSKETGEEGLFYKFKLMLSETERAAIITSLSSKERIYEVGEIELNDGKGTAVAYSVSRYIEFYNECLENGRAITNDGAPGAGKTFTGAQMAYFLARRQWDKLKSDYFTQRTMIAEWIKHGDTDKLSAFRALEESYRYYSDREQTHIPCLVSSIPLKEYGTQRMSYKLTAEIFLQIDRCPEYSVIFNDESGLGQGADKSKTDDQDVLSFWRFPRHFFDGFFVNTNQDGAQNAIFMRRSTDYLNHIKGQEWLLRPVRLEKRIARRERRYYKYIDRHNLTGKAYKKGQKLYYLKRYAATIGFRRVRHRLTTTSGEPVGEEREYIFPAIGGLDYDDRAYRNLYKCKDKAIDLAGWEKLVVDESTHGAFDRLVADKATA